MKVLLAAALAAALAIALAGCTTSTTGEVLTLPSTGRVDYQLGGAYTPPADVSVVARDSTDPPLAGVYSICYLNGFQSQPQQAQFWLDEHPDLLRIFRLIRYEAQLVTVTFKSACSPRQWRCW